PSYIHIDPRHRVKIRVDSDKPYRYYDRHKRRFGPAPDYGRDHKYDRDRHRDSDRKYDRDRDRVDRDRDARERDANRKWYRQYQKQQPAQGRHDNGKRHSDKRRDYDRGNQNRNRDSGGNRNNRGDWGDDDGGDSPKKRPWYR
ncbi:MAG: hypothetical protein PVG89_13300, partial [Gammaproteobacteria bacterium]